MDGHTFKTIYFPRDRVQNGKATRVTVSLPTIDADQDSLGFASFAAGLSSGEFRKAIGDPMLEDLEAIAHAEGRSFSNACVQLLRQAFCSRVPTAMPSVAQLPLPMGLTSPGNEAAVGVTFQESKRLPVHGWYPYVEGFSAPYVKEVFDRFGRPACVYDPFGGSGTTQLAASTLGVPSSYAEVNPFMAFVANTKVESSRWARANLDLTDDLVEGFVGRLGPELDDRAGQVDLTSYEEAFPDRDFFEERHIRHLLAALDLADDVALDTEPVRDLLRLACASIAVGSSNMTRRADLRRRRADEYKNRVVDVPTSLRDTLGRMLSDLHRHPRDTAPSTFVASDCRQVPSTLNETFELAITSPPYLNGTNYFRNTKIELWLLGFIKTERELGGFRAQAVAAGINNVTKTRTSYLAFEAVEAVARKLDEQATDQRIPLLVRHYFSDMSEVLASVYRVLQPGGRFVFDIGDSKFYGVHVPTDVLIEHVAGTIGFEVESGTVLARRYSRDKSELVQRELVFRKS